MASTENERSVDEWREALDQEDESLRFNAAVELARRKDPVAIPVLVRALGHEVWAIRHFHAHRALVHLGEPATPSLMATLDEGGVALPVAAHTLFKIDAAHREHALAALGRALRSEDAAVREDAAHVLGEMGDAAKPLASALTTILQDERETASARRNAAAALMRLGAATPEVAPALVSLLRSASWSARFRAVAALGQRGGEARAAIPDVIALLANSRESTDTRVDAAQVLGMIGGASRETVSALLAALHDSDWWVRLYAARALGEFGARGAAEATGALADALRDENVDVRRGAAWSLSRLPADSGEAVPALIATLGDPVVGGVAAEALAKIGGPALPALQEALKSASDGVSGRAAYALKKMETPEAAELLDAWTAATGRQPLALAYADFFLPAQDIRLTPEKEADFDRLLEAAGEGGVVDYRCPYPKHEFLYYLVQRRGCVLHGSNRTDIDLMRPVRTSLESEDGNPLGNINGVYATPDEIWPMFFALVDRIHHDVWLINGPFEGPDAAGETRKFYQFSINVESLRQRPYADGMVYILPGATFENANGAERASRVPVKPLAKLPVSPADFPYLAQMRGFNTRRPGWPSAEGFVFLDEVEKIVVRSLP